MAAETVSIVFTDLVGSTEILSRLGENRAEELRRRFFGLLREGTAAHGGREVKNLGDGLMLVFPSASDAVSGAVTIQRLALTFNRGSDVPLLIRVGGSTGDADVADDDYFGVVVVEAARLCALCEGGQILVTESMRHLARDRTGHRYESLGDLELKGLDGTVSTYQVRWEPLDAHASGVPLPTRLERGSAVEFVGRRSEIEHCQEILKEVDTSQRRHVVLLGGEAGIGKTSLVAECARQAHANGAVVLYGRCDEGLGIPYQPWAEALGHLVRHVDLAVIEAHVALRGGDLGRFVQPLVERVGSLPPPRSDDPETSRHLLFGSVVDLLRRASQNHTLLVVLDDLHWADRNTVELLRHVAATTDDTNLALFGTYREADIGPKHPLTDLLAALHREEGVDRVQLRGLDDREVAELMEAAAGHPLDAEALELRDALARETSGNPFFVSEMLRHLAETGAIALEEDGRWRAQIDLRTAGLPVSVREVVGRRIAHLGEDARRILSAAAVIGREFDLAVLMLVTDTADTDLVDILDEAASASVVEEVAGVDDRYTFVHALIQHALHVELGAARRRLLHRQVAEALESVAGAVVERPAELAGHLLEATRPQDLDKTLKYVLLAGDQAQDRLAPDEAVRWYAQALELVERFTDDGANRTRCLLRLGTAQRLAGLGDYRQTLLDAARLADERGDAGRLAASALANFRGFFSIAGGSDPERIAVLEAALARLGEDDEALRARLLARLAVETIFAADRAPGDTLDAALEAAEASGSDDARIDALLALGTTYTPRSLRRRLERLPELLELTASSGDPARQFWAVAWAVIAWSQAGELAKARSAFAKQRRFADEIGDPTIGLMASMLEAMLIAATGDLDEGERLANYVLDRGVEFAVANPDAPLFGGSQIGTLAYLRGCWEDGALMCDVLSTEFDLPVLHASHAGFLLHAGRADAARVVAGRLDGFDVDGSASRDPISGGTFAALALASPVIPASLLVPLVNVLAELRGQILMTGATIVWPAELGRALVLTTLRRYDEADRDFAAAWTITESLSMTVAMAWTEWKWAQMLAERGDPADRVRVCELATTALAIAGARGCPGVADACARLLESASSDAP